MDTTLTIALEPLSQSDLTVADSAEDIRGRQVLDLGGNEVGSVEDLIIDREQGKVRFLQLGAGGFLGIGEDKFLVPVDAVTRVEDDAVHIDKTREHVAGGPKYEPDLVADMDYYGGVYGYYGYGPFWAPGYAYPPYPYYRR